MEQLNPTDEAACADVVIPVYADVELTRACISAVLETSGAALSRLILVDDCGPDPAMRPMLRAFREADPRVRVLENPRNLGFVGTANRGLSICEGHAVILNSDTRVTPGWLEALLRVLDRSERIAAVCPLSNNGTLCSVPDFGASADAGSVERGIGDLASLPEWTELPTGNGFCMLMRGSARAALGLFDPAFGRGYNEENDWCQRARALGMVIARANRAFVFHRGEVSFSGARRMLDLVNAQRLVARFPQYLAENRHFEQDPEAHLAASAVRARLGQVRVALHRGLEGCIGLDALTAGLEADARFTSVRAQGEEANVELLLAPLDHPEAAQAREALSGTGRLVTVVDAWRPARFGWQRGARRLQLLASDRVLVPSARVERWVSEEVPEARVQVMPWPTSVMPQLQSKDCSRLVTWSPTPAVRALIAEGLLDSGLPLELAVVDASSTASMRHACLREAYALVDLGGTPAGLHAEADALGAPVISGLMGLAVEEGDAASPVIGVRWLQQELRRLSQRPGRPAAADSRACLATWRACLLEVVASPVGAAAALRAALRTH